MGQLEGRVAFVTGAGRGIGAATALRMAEEGARVALADIDTEGCRQVAAKTIPVRRVGQPRDVANVICFLASEEAGFVSGQIIYVAGAPRG